MNKLKKAGFELIVALGCLSVLATLLSLIPAPYWWVRAFDYPRAQVAGLCVIVLLISLFLPNRHIWLKTSWLLLLLASLVYQLSRIIVYTPLWEKQALDSNQPAGSSQFSLLISNVLMTNRQAQEFLQLVKDKNPDLILVNEPDAWWAEQLKPLDKAYPYHLKQPQDNTYGMIFYSRLPLRRKELRFLVQEKIPSVYAEVELPNGRTFDFYGLHPRPPKPGNDTYQRDAEVLIVGKEVYARKRPAVVAGDLNDVAWSETSALFQRYSGLLDPRQGRGLYNTFNAQIPLLRYPVDHVFYSSGFGFLRMERLRKIGSDHFPMYISLNFEPGKDNAQDKPERDAEDVEEATEKIHKGR